MNDKSAWRPAPRARSRRCRPPICQLLEGRALLSAAPLHLAFMVQPTRTMAQAVLLPPVFVDVKDSRGNTVTTDATSVTLTLSGSSAAPTGGALGGTTTVSAVGGVAGFTNLSIDAPGVYRLIASDGADVPALSYAFSVTPALHLAFIDQPTGATAGNTLPPVTVHVEDPDGNTVAGNASFVTLSLNGGAIGGKSVVQAVNGIAVFNDVVVPAPADALTLSASDGSIARATSSAFSITPLAAGPMTLAPTVVASSLPVQIAAGASARGDVVVQLTNDTPAVEKGRVVVNLLATDGAVDPGAVPLGSASRQVNLRPGQQVNVRVPVKSLPVSLAQGTYRLLGQSIDPAGVTSDGVIGPILQLRPATASLQANVGLPAAAIVHLGGFDAAPVELINVGDLNVEGTVSFQVGLSSDGLTDAFPLQTLSRNVIVKAGKTRLLSLSFRPEPPVASADYFLFVSVTADGVTAPSVGAGVVTVVG